jgi:ribose 5-phosphate isomerase B
MQNLYLIADHAGYQLANEITKLNKDIINLTPDFIEGDDYTDKAIILAEYIKKNEIALGIALCGSGQGICMALNRFYFIRAGLGYDKLSAQLMKEHNNANVICLPAREITADQATEYINIFQKTSFSHQQRHKRRVEKLNNVQ